MNVYDIHQTLSLMYFTPTCKMIYYRCSLFPPQDLLSIPLHVALKTITLNNVRLTKFRCRRGSNALEGLHSHLLHAVPLHRCSIMPFQVNI